MANLADHRTRLARLFAGAGPHGGDRRAGRRAAGRAVRATSTRRSTRSPASRAPTCRTRSAAGRPRWTTAIEELPKQRPFLANTRGLLPRPAPRRQGAVGRRARPGRRVHDRHAGAARVGRAQPAPQADLRRAAALRRGPAGPARRQRPRRTTATIANPLFAAITPTQTVCNYWTLLFRNAASLLSEGDTNGTGQRFMIVATPQGPNNEGGPSVGARPTAPARGQLPARQPVPEHGGAGPDAGVRGRQRALHRRASRSSATCPGNQGTTTQKTTSLERHDRRHERPRRQAPSASCARTAPGSARSTVGAARARRRRDRRLLRLRQARAVHARLPRQGRLHHRQQHPAQLAGAHRRRQHRQGQEGRGLQGRRRQRVARDDGDRRRPGCRSTRTRR